MPERATGRAWHDRWAGCDRYDISERQLTSARKLVELAIARMEAVGADEIVLETEFDNGPSLALYEALGFVREKRLHRFYSNGKDA